MKPKKCPRRRPERVIPELPGPGTREIWETIFANATLPDPALADAKRLTD